MQILHEHHKMQMLSPGTARSNQNKQKYSQEKDKFPYYAYA